LVCDYRLRGDRTGVEAITTIRDQIDTELPALLITGDTDPVLNNRLKQNGYYVLRKPIRPAQLKNAIASLVS